MRAERYLELLEADAGRLSAVARAADLGAAIPSCPGWTIEDCVAHIAEVYLARGRRPKIACMRLQRRPGEDYEQRPPAGIGVLDWFDTSAASLLDELRRRGPEAPAYTWWPADQTVGFWYRRMAQETAVHRLDVEDGAGQPTPIDPELALDGIDEVLDRFMSDGWDDVTPEEWGQVDPHAGEGQTVAVYSGGRIWRSTLGPELIPLERSDGSANAAVSGQPEEVLLWLWGRRPDDSVQLMGDRSAIRAFQDRLHIATQ